MVKQIDRNYVEVVDTTMEQMLKTVTKPEQKALKELLEDAVSRAYYASFHVKEKGTLE